MKPRSSKVLTLLLAIAALLLVGVLAFLYHKTLATDSRAQNEALDALRELKDIDTQWDRAALLAQFKPNEKPAFSRLDDPQKILDDLTARARALHSAALNAGLPELRASIAEKIARIRQLQNAGSRDAAVSPVAKRAYAQLSLLTAGPRIDTLTRTFSQEIAASIAEKERFHAYLVAYAGALLLLTGWLVGKLRTANIDLEQRIEDRTRELSNAIAHLKESESQLVQSEKMAALGQMVAGVAHEIHTPLAYVKNSLNNVSEKLPAFRDTVAQSAHLLKLLQAGANADPKALSYQFKRVSEDLAQLRRQNTLDEIDALIKHGLHGIEHMADIVGDLKDFSRLDRGKIAHFNLNHGLESTLTIASSQLKKLEVVKHFGDIPDIICAPSQVNQVFLNLITNAAHAMAEGGTLTLTTRAEHGGVAVEVADTGVGIPPDVLPKIFDPFFTTKKVGEGTGLGLSVSYKIVKEHGGHFDVVSKLGKGSRFTVWLPSAPPETLA